MILTTGRKNRRCGITLVELILVLVLISTLLAMCAPSLRGMLASRRGQDAAARLLALMQWARSQAAAEGTVYRLNVDSEDNTHWLTAQQAGIFTEVHSDLGRRICLADGQTISLQVDMSQTAPRSSIPGQGLFGQRGLGQNTLSRNLLGQGLPGQTPLQNADYIQFYPDGRNDPAVIEITDRQGTIYRIVSPSATEGFRIVSGAAEGTR
jgi:type II secretory pathway pseudopilin PulG